LILSAAVSIRSRTGVIIFKKEWKELRGACGGEKERKVTVEDSEKKRDALKEGRGDGRCKSKGETDANK
jgi:hypothetical protein